MVWEAYVAIRATAEVETDQAVFVLLAKDVLSDLVVVETHVGWWAGEVMVR